MIGLQGGDTFGPYRVLGLLGRGGMGQVFRAHDDEHEREVALKVLPAQWAADEGYRERFRREARIAARLHEPHVVPIHRYGEIDGSLFLDMRLVEGEDLASLLDRAGPLDPARAVDLVGQVARALDAAHAGGLVHRDVKPSNVLLVGRADGGDLATSAAGEDFAYLADFGIARVADETTGPGLTGTGLAIGSTEYMAPERFGRAPLDGRADVYSLACVLFELLTGRRPFAPGDPMGLMYAHLHEEPPAPSALRPGLPAALDAVVLRGLAKDPAQRWPTAGAMAAGARAALAASGVAVPHQPGDAGTAVGAVPAEAGRAPTRRHEQPAPPAPPTTVRPRDGEPPPPDAPGRRSRPDRLPVLVALGTSLVLVVALVVLLVVTDRRADRSAAAAAETAQRLLTLSLPADVDPATCTVETPADGELRRLSCPPGTDEDGPAGPSSSSYALHEGSGADAAFTADVTDGGLRELEEVYGCGSSSEGPEGWVQLTDDEDEVVGRLSCSVDGDGDSVLTWTWDDLGTLAVVELRGQGEEGLATLRSWWESGADRGI